MGKGARKTVGRVLTALVVAVLILGAGLAYVNRQLISDHFAAQNFTPTSEVSDLIDRLDLTDSGRRVFLASEPTLDASQQFNERCADVDHEEGSHVLGCFANGKIHLFHVTDERLDGIVEVTAAHELLHAVYSRFSSSTRADLSVRLREAYESLIAENPELEERMSVYSRLSDASFANELHSVLGTEARELPEWLEQHYAEWLQNRALIVDFFDAYHSVFVQLRARVDQLQAELVELRSDIELRSAAYDAAVQTFNAEVADFNRRNEAFEFSDNAAEFWRIRGELQARSEELQGELAGLEADLERYEAMREELEQLGATGVELAQHLDSRLAPPVEP